MAEEAKDESGKAGSTNWAAQVTLAAAECEQYGVDQETFSAAILNGDLDALDRLGACLLNVLANRKNAVGNSVFSFLVAEVTRQRAPAQWTRFVATYLGADRYGALQLQVRQDALDRAVLCQIAYPEATTGPVARFAGISPGELRKWKRAGILQRAVKAKAEWLEREMRKPARVAALLAVLPLAPLEKPSSSE